MMATQGWRSAGLAAWMLAGGGWLAGCESTPRSTTSLQSSVTHYEAGRYALAEHEALETMQTQRSSAGLRAEAAYIAGLSSYQLGKHHEALTHLRIAASSRDSQTAGRSEAMLGIIKLDLDQPASAMSHLDRAAVQLIGDEREEAQRHAALARRLASGMRGTRGTPSSPASASASAPSVAVTSATIAQRHAQAERSGSVEPAATSIAQYGTGRFVLQAGAFRDRNRARDASQELSTLARASGLGDVRIVPSRDDRGQMLYLVQLGGFHSRSEAVRARQSLARLDFIVTTSSTMPDAG